MAAESIDILARPGSPAPTARIGRDLFAAQRSFAQVLGKAMPEPAPQSREAQARDTAEQVVTISLVQPLLKQLRETNHAAPPFAPTPAEKQFRSLTDATLAQNIVKSKHFPIVDRMTQLLLDRGGTLASGRTIQQELAAARTPAPQQRPSGVTGLAP